jgi:hypothetical protein
MADNSSPMQGRWYREATEKEVRWLTKNHSGEAEMIEWGWAGQTYWVFKRHMFIVRSNILGGGVVDIHGGWKYADFLKLQLDLAEIRKLATVNFLNN